MDLTTEVTLDSTESPNQVFLETDDTNPNQVIYDLDNNETIIPSEEDFTTPTLTEEPVFKKIVSRNVGSTRRRRFR